MVIIFTETDPSPFSAISRSADRSNSDLVFSRLEAFITLVNDVLHLDRVSPNDDPFVFWFVLTTQIVNVGLIICFQILFASTLADLVEDSQAKTGRRSERVFNAAERFIEKSVTGIGVMAATAVLQFSGLSTGANANDVSAQTVWLMGAY